MAGLGTLVNVAAIIAGAVVGLLVKRGLPENWQQTMMSGIALCIFVIGLQMALATENIIITVVSLATGAIIGEALGIEARLNQLGNWVGSKAADKEEGAAKRIAEGFVSATLLFCIGAMAVVGSIQDGLAGDHTTLFAKATLDGIISVILSANLGIGVMFSSVSVGLYQGAITALAGFLEPYVAGGVLTEITAAGGVMIMAIGTNMLNITKIRISNMLPGIITAALIGTYFC